MILTRHQKKDRTEVVKATILLRLIAETGGHSLCNLLWQGWNDASDQEKCDAAQTIYRGMEHVAAVRLKTKRLSEDGFDLLNGFEVKTTSIAEKIQNGYISRRVQLSRMKGKSKTIAFVANPYTLKVDVFKFTQEAINSAVSCGLMQGTYNLKVNTYNGRWDDAYVESI